MLNSIFSFKKYLKTKKEHEVIKDSKAQKQNKKSLNFLQTNLVTNFIVLKEISFLNEVIIMVFNIL